MVPLRSHGDGHLHLLQQGGVDLRHPSPNHARVVDLVRVLVSGQEAVGERNEQKLSKNTEKNIKRRIVWVVMSLTGMLQHKKKSKHWCFPLDSPSV